MKTIHIFFEHYLDAWKFARQGKLKNVRIKKLSLRLYQLSYRG
jgi:hypothetical protein